jgi:hypothetical protein
MSACPFCKVKTDYCTICDNDCGTYSCDSCGKEWYNVTVDGINIVVSGHNDSACDSEIEEK